MGEFLFAIKTVIISVLLIFALQIQIDETTLEERAEDWVRTSSITKHLNQVAKGAVLIVREGTSQAVRTIRTTLSGNHSPALPVESAGRLNLDFVRSPAAATAIEKQSKDELRDNKYRNLAPAQSGDDFSSLEPSSEAKRQTHPKL